MNQRSERGFTLIEVVLAIAVGLIIIAGVSVGYTYAKRSAILNNQRKNVGAVKTFVEQAIASLQANLASGDTIGFSPPAITNGQLAALANRLPSLNFDPYTGVQRGTDTPGCGPVFPQIPCTGCAVSASCYAAAAKQAIGVYGPKFTDGDTVPSAPTLTGGSALIYVPGMSFKTSQFTITLADGSTRTFYGYVIVESDQDGNIVAADGGDITTTQIGP